MEIPDETNCSQTTRVKIRINGPEGRRIEHMARVAEERELVGAIEAALDLYRRFYPDAPPFRKTVAIDPA